MRKGDTGADVRALQQLLGIDVDGWFGAETEAAVKSAQQRDGLVIDGIAGPKTMLTLKRGRKPDHLLTHGAIEQAAAALGVPVASVLAVNEVESRGLGFLDNGKPAILFERHIMYRQLDQAGQDVKALTERYPNIVNHQRGGYAGGVAEHARLSTATGIDRECAPESASWGLFQIMGYHWEQLGYESAEAFVAAMSSNEDEQLAAFVRFIEADAALHKALKGRKWAEFAKIYNGPDYKENLYDVKLSRAYDRHFGEAA